MLDDSTDELAAGLVDWSTRPRDIALPGRATIIHLHIQGNRLSGKYGNVREGTVRPEKCLKSREKFGVKNYSHLGLRHAVFVSTSITQYTRIFVILLKYDAGNYMPRRVNGNVHGAQRACSATSAISLNLIAMYTVSQKRSTKRVAITLSNLNRFSKFLHR